MLLSLAASAHGQLNTTVNNFGAGGLGTAGWQSDDTRRSDGVHIINGTTNAPLGSATLDPAGVALQIDWLNNNGSRGNLGGVRLDGTTSGSGKSTLSVIDATSGLSAASVLNDPGFSTTYRWQNNDTVAPGVAFKIGIQSTNWGTGVGQSQNGYVPTRSGEPSWDLLLVYDPAEPTNMPGNSTTNGAFHTSVISQTSGLFYLFDQAGNTFYTPPGFTGKTLAQWAADPTWGPLLFGAGAKISNTQFGIGSGNQDALGTVDFASISYLNSGKIIDFADGTKWTNAAGGTLSTGANWEGGVAPGATVNGLFDLNNTYTVSVPASTSVRTLGVTNGNVTFDVAASQTLTLANDGYLFAESGATLSTTGAGAVSAATLDAYGTINVATTTTLNGGSVSHPVRDGNPSATTRYGLVVSAGGTVTLQSGADVTISQTNKNVGMRVGEGTGTGTLNIQAGANLEVGNSDSFGVNGLTSNGFIVVGDFGSTGVVSQTGGSVTLTDGSFNLGNQAGTGTWSISAGSLTLEGGLHSLGRNTSNRAAGTGTLNISGTALMEIKSSLNNGNATFVIGDRDDSVTDGSGVINQTGGTFRVAANSQLFLGGHGSSQYNLNGGTLEIGGNSLQELYQNGPGGSYAFNLGGGTIKVTGSNLTTAADPVLAAATTSKIDTNGFTATLSGVITGPGALEKQGSGDLQLTAANSYAGATTVTAGTIEVSADNGLGTNAAGTTVANGASIKLSNVNYTTAEGLELNGNGVGGAGALQNSGTSTFAGPITAATSSKISAGGGTLNLTGGITKDGTTVTMTGGGRINVSGTGISGASANSDLVIDGTTVVTSVASTYNGPTTVQNSGTLLANNTSGSATGTGNVTIDTTSTLSGTGTVNAGANNLIYLNGALIVGDSTLGSPVASNLTVATSGTGSTILGATSEIQFDLFSGAGNGNNTGNAAAADYLKLFGLLDSSLGGTLVLSNPNNLTGFADGDSWKIFDLATGPGSISGTLALDFTALNLAPTLYGVFDNNSGNFSIAPEPGRAMFLALGGIALIMRRRRQS